MTAINFDNSYSRLPDNFFARQDPDVSPAPVLIALNEPLARRLGIDPTFLKSKDGLALLSGQSVADGSKPLAMVYAGHQFGGWSPRLGDGRALLLGEVIGTDGIRYDIQLKGSGRTLFSRGGDGKAAIGPVIREYVVSEAMAALGVPTTRALAAIATGEDVMRNAALPGGIVTRVAQSHIRVGTFQYFASHDDVDALRVLSDYVIDRHFPDVRNSENPIREMFRSIALRQASLIADWMRFGFIHGVMNTDNMQIAGETIDYGPCAFMEEFDALQVFSSIDQKGRYAWARQATMAHWNLTRLAETLLPIWGLPEDEAVAEAEDVLSEFGARFNAGFQKAFAQKFGLPADHKDNTEFIQKALQMMQAQHVDFTLFFSHLRRMEKAGHADKFSALFDDPKVGVEWLSVWRQMVNTSGIDLSDSQARMDAANPIYIPRNHRVEQAIQAGLKGDYSVMQRLAKVLENPMSEQADAAEFENPPEPDQRVTQTFCGT